ncbi:MAG: hypothetical protein E7270_00140 [Lachnospiraceae bacterium]|nr:hypothetical protein [Lachnospiraceae bacterium]MBQ4068029.1 hypothetical protein [Lachnospiraceae bacterium]
MTDYVRILSYIYLYENGRKVKNVGFVKMDGRDGMIKISVNIRIPFKNDLRKLRLIVYNEKEGEIIPTQVGEMHLVKGMGEFQGHLKLESDANYIGMNICSVDEGELLQFATYFKDTDINIIKIEEKPIYNDIDIKAASIEKNSMEVSEPGWWSDLSGSYCKSRILGDEYQCIKVNDKGILLIRCNKDNTYYIGVPSRIEDI